MHDIEGILKAALNVETLRAVCVTSSKGEEWHTTSPYVIGKLLKDFIMQLLWTKVLRGRTLPGRKPTAPVQWKKSKPTRSVSMLVHSLSHQSLSPNVVSKRFGRCKVLTEQFSFDFHCKHKPKWSLSTICPTSESWRPSSVSPHPDVNRSVVTLGSVYDQWYRTPKDVEGGNQSLTVSRLWTLMKGSDTLLPPDPIPDLAGSWVDVGLAIVRLHGLLY